MATMLNSRNRQDIGYRSIYKNDESLRSRNLSNIVCPKYMNTINETKTKNRLNELSMPKKQKDRSQLETGAVSSGAAQNLFQLHRKELQDQTFALNFATYLKAFALIYVLPEEEWKAEIIDKLLKEGEELLDLSEDNLHVDKRIRRNFRLEGHNFTVELKPIYAGDPKTPIKLRPEHLIRNLRSVLQGFFGTAHYCLLLCSTGYLLIWRRRKLYFIMDIKSRRIEHTLSISHGLTMLVCLQTMDKVVHFISNLSGIRPRDAFSIREISVVRLVTPEGRIFVRETNEESIEYNMINKNYAYLKSTLHLSLNPRDLLRNKSSLIVCVAAILAAKIDHPASWNTNMLDRLICYGVELFRSFWGADMQDRLPIDLHKFPTQLRLGQFVVELRLLPNITSGQWRCGVCYKGNDFDRRLRQSLMDYGNCLFQLNKQIYAVWCKDDFYYLLDPYRHSVVGCQVTDDDKSTKWATVRMFRDWVTMLSVFHQLLKESNRNCRFDIHVVCIRNIAKCPQGYALKPLPPETDYEVNSINETIAFSEDVRDCTQLLAKLSDHPLEVFSETGETLDLENFRLLDEGDFENVFEEKSEGVSSFGYRNPKPPNNSELSKVYNSTLSKAASANRRSQVVTTKPLGKQNNRRPPIATKTVKNSVARRKGGAESAFKQSVSPIKSGDFVTRAAKKDASVRISDCKCNPVNQVHFDEHGNQTKLNATSQTSYQTAGLPSSEPDSVVAAAPKIETITYPIYSKYPHKLAVAGSESGTLESLHRLLKSAFSVTNRVFTMTPWGNYVIFRHSVEKNPKRFYLFDGCTCNIDRFRHVDLNNGTGGLKQFDSRKQLVCYMIDSRETRALNVMRTRLEQPCRQLENVLGRGA